MRSEHELSGLFTGDDGIELSGFAAKQILMDELQKGHLFIKDIACDNFDPKEGCLGHVPEQEDAS